MPLRMEDAFDSATSASDVALAPTRMRRSPVSVTPLRDVGMPGGFRRDGEPFRGEAQARAPPRDRSPSASWRAVGQLTNSEEIRRGRLAAIQQSTSVAVERDYVTEMHQEPAPRGPASSWLLSRGSESLAAR
jgi:hypothetical protein